METTFTSNDIYAGKYEGIVVFTYEERSDTEAKLIQRSGRNLVIARERKEFEGKQGQSFLIVQEQGIRFVAIVGLGKRSEVKIANMRNASAIGVALLREKGAKVIAVEVPPELDAGKASQAVTEGALLISYRFTKYKTQKVEEIKQIQHITIVSDRTGMAAKLGFDAGVIITDSCNMVRDLQNLPSCDMTPANFAEVAYQMAKKEKLDCRILDRKALEKGGWGGILAVGKGSAQEPRLVTIEYAPKGAKKTIAVVGKGVTFDTGGISIKPAPSMADMKFDMSGAAATIGIVRNASRLKLPVRVIGIMGLAENMLGSESYKPGDIVKTKMGKTIEVDNTDAEGRIVLADALYHATTFKPDAIIDLATLTGACVVALGDVASGLLGNDQALIDQIISASERSGEKTWQLPLWEEYDKDIESPIADMRNVGLPRMAGAISAAALLKQFVGETPWAHLDIAGVAWADARDRYFTRCKEGGTAYGVRLITEFLRET